MILVDTSIWADHFRKPIDELEGLVAAVMVVQHPFVTGELALGNFRDRSAAVDFLQALPPAVVASEGDFLTFVSARGLAGTGIGFVDAHLLAACRLMPGTLIWSRDKKLQAWAERIGVAWTPQ